MLVQLPRIQAMPLQVIRWQFDSTAFMPAVLQGIPNVSYDRPFGNARSGEPRHLIRVQNLIRERQARN